MIGFPNHQIALAVSEVKIELVLEFRHDYLPDFTSIKFVIHEMIGVNKKHEAGAWTYL